MVSSLEKRFIPSNTCNARSPRNQLACRKRLAPTKYSHQECNQSCRRIDPIVRSPAHRHVRSNLTYQVDPLQKIYEDPPAKGRNGSVRLSNDWPLLRQQSKRLARD
jgi:hypothetical protein